VVGDTPFSSLLSQHSKLPAIDIPRVPKDLPFISRILREQIAFLEVLLQLVLHKGLGKRRPEEAAIT